MFSLITRFVTAPYTIEQGKKSANSKRFIGVFLDIIAGLALLLLGIYSHRLGISSAVQYALIGAGFTYVMIMLSIIVSGVKDHLHIKAKQKALHLKI